MSSSAGAYSRFSCLVCMSCNPPHGDPLIRSLRMTYVYPYHLSSCTMTTFAAGLPLAYSCHLNTNTFWFHQHVLPRLLSHLLRGWCIIFRKSIIRCQNCSQVVTFYPVNELRSDAEISPVCRIFRITPSSQALKIIQEPLSSFFKSHHRLVALHP